MPASFRILFTTLFVFVCMMTPFTPSLHATTVEELQSSISSINKQLEAVNKEITEFNKKISQTKGEAKTLNAALAKLELERAALLKQIDYTMLQIQKTNKNISVTKTHISSTTKSISVNQDSIAEMLRALAQGKNKPPLVVDMLAKQGTLSDMFDAVTRINDVRDAVAMRVHALQENKNDLQIAQAAYEESQRQLEDLQGTLLGQKSIVESTSKQKSTLLVQTKNKESEYQKLLTEQKAKKNALEKEVQDFEAKLKVAVDKSKLPPSGSGVLSWPLKNVKITQYFGNTSFASINPQVYTSGSHNGLDLAASVGTPIYSAQSGIVIGTGNTDTACRGASYGRWILIRHNNGLSTLYAHLSKTDVVEGQQVKLGERIGLSGNTGYSTGPHLHFTVYASDSVHVLGSTEYVSRACGTYMVFPVAPKGGYLNPLSYL